MHAWKSEMQWLHGVLARGAALQFLIAVLHFYKPAN